MDNLDNSSVNSDSFVESSTTIYNFLPSDLAFS
jgi:hypothetical protein